MASDDQPRIAPLSPRAWPPAMREALRPLSPPTPRPDGMPKGMNVLGTFAHHPDLTAAFTVFNGYILYGSTLTDRQRELAILRVATRRGSSYEWEQHVHAARACGIADDEIERVRAGGPDGWPSAEAALLVAVDELISHGSITDATWAALKAEHTDQEVLDLVFTVGAYEIVAMMLNVAKTPLDDDLRPDS